MQQPGYTRWVPAWAAALYSLGSDTVLAEVLKHDLESSRRPPVRRSPCPFAGVTMSDHHVVSARTGSPRNFRKALSSPSARAGIATHGSTLLSPSDDNQTANFERAGTALHGPNGSRQGRDQGSHYAGCQGWDPRVPTKSTRRVCAPRRCRCFQKESDRIPRCCRPNRRFGEAEVWERLSGELRVRRRHWKPLGRNLCGNACHSLTSIPQRCRVTGSNSRCWRKSKTRGSDDSSKVTLAREHQAGLTP